MRTTGPHPLRLFATKLFWGLVNPFRRVYWFVARPRTYGAKCALLHGDEILLVRLNYAHRGWTCPGGGVGRNETFRDAALRELREETGIAIADGEDIGFFESRVQYKRDCVHVVRAHAPERLTASADGIEVQDVRWFRLDALPAERRPSVDRVVEMLRAAATDGAG